MSSATVELYLVRHADAGDPAAWPGDDAVRPLSDKGRRQCADVAAWLGRAIKPPDVIVTSPKLRALDTARLVGAAWSMAPVVDDRLASGADIGDVAAIVRHVGPRPGRVMLVGHDPDVSEVASGLIGCQVTMKKGAVARIDLPLPIRAGEGSLRWLVPPDALGGPATGEAGAEVSSEPAPPDDVPAS